MPEIIEVPNKTIQLPTSKEWEKYGKSSQAHEETEERIL
jgi:hypothetical protein